MMRLAALAPLFSLMCLTSCGGGSSSSSAPTGPHIQTQPIFSSSEIFVSAQPGAWSPDGSKVAFEDTQPDIYVVSATGGTPVKATDSASDSELGGGSPAFLGDGRLVYYRGWLGDDHNMHYMVAPSTQVANSPAAAALLTFNGSDVGLSANAASSPGCITLSSDGKKAVYGTWLLDWSTGSLVTTHFANSTELMVSPEGTHVAWVNASGVITIRALATQQETVVGSGINISWATGARLGYAVSDAYKVYTLSTGITRTYSASLSLHGPGCPRLSPDATRILYRTFGGAYTGLSVGRLVD